MTETDNMQHHLAWLQLPDAAQSWLLMLWEVIQFFDDVADGDMVQRSVLDSVLWNVLIDMQRNVFYLSNAAILLPVMSNAILQWQASDNVEKRKEHDAKSYVWRASFYTVLLTVCQLCHGHEWATQNADKVLSLYGENLDDYLKGF